MKWWTLFLLVILCSNSQAQTATPSASQPSAPVVDFDDDKPTLYLSDYSLLVNKGGNSELSDDAKKLITAVAKSGQFNLVFYSGYGANTGLEEKVRKHLKAIDAENSSMFYESASSQIKNKMGNLYGGPTSYNLDMGPNGIRNDFYAIVDKFHASKGDANNFGYGGNDPLRGVPESQEMLLDLGEAVFNENFSFKDLSPKLNYNNTPVTCEFEKGSNTKIILDVTICLRDLETEYRWINEKKKVCGLYEPKKEKAVKSVDYLHCEPLYIQEFEEYRGLKIGEVCNDARDCLGRFMNDEAIDLVDEFKKILIHERVQEQRRKVYDSESYAYQNDINDIVKDIREFKNSCEDRYLEKWVSEFFAKNPGDEEKFKDLLLETKNTYIENLAPFFSSEEIKEIIEDGNRDFTKCIQQESERHSRYGANLDFDNILKSCSYSRMAAALKAHKDKLSATDKDPNQFRQYVNEKLNGICPYKDDSYSYNDSYNIPRFDQSFDAKRCFRAVSDYREKFDDLMKYGDDIKLALNPVRDFGGDERVFTEAFHKYKEECGSDDEEKCLDEAKRKAQAETVYLSLSQSGIDYKSEEADFRRTPKARDTFIESASQDDELWDCLESRGRHEECMEKANSHFVREREGILGRSKAVIAEDALYDDLEGLVKELDREISVFHWGSDELSGFNAEEPVPLNSLRGYSYLRLREHMFHTGPMLDKRVADPGNGTMAGRGLYAAADPNSTSSYGETLFEIKIPEGSKFLDLREKRTSGKIPLSRDTLRKLTEAGCEIDARYIDEYERSESNAIRNDTDLSREERNTKRSDLQDEVNKSRESSRFLVSDYYDSNYVMVEKAVFEKFRECNTAFSRVVDRLDLNFLAYDYGTEKPEFCDNVYDQTAAFVMIDTKIRGHTRQYNRKAIADAIEAFEEKGTPIPQDIKRILQIGNYALGDSYSDTNEKVNGDVSDSEVISYWKDRIFQCNALNESDRVKSAEGNY
ncbi:MAG: hypothetical protein VXV96_17140 [Bdellovibrionota bacterium]|nr:hypothetical protein [Bdellovibrionota bacterium]